MNAQIVFLTLFLGVVSGPHPVSLQVSGPVKTVRLSLGDHEVAVLNQPPWRATVNMGPDLTPRELTAVGFDADGREIARAAQILNLPRPVAELDIALEYRKGEAPTGLTLRSRHIVNLAPVKAQATLDGKTLTLDRKLHTALPKLDLEMPHVISAEVHFADGYVAKNERVIESVRSDSVGTQLTPIAVRETSAKHPASWDGCLVGPSGKRVRLAAMENPRGLIIVVREPTERQALRSGWSGANERFVFDKGTFQRMIWPVAELYPGQDNPSSRLFPPSADFDAGRTPFLNFAALRGPITLDEESRLFADAVATAGVNGATGTQRRAVILILDHRKDLSDNRPAAVRRYLAALGVPLFVWSSNGAPSPEWGEIEDVSTAAKLEHALDRVRSTLNEQRIAWVDVDPLTALRLTAEPRCGFETIARP